MNSQLDIESKLDGKLQIIYLNRPESFNSLNADLLKELRGKISAFNADENVRCIAVSGRGKAFCSGQNLKDALAMETGGNQNVIQKMVTDYYNPLVLEITSCSKPVVALVNGPAVGAGAMLALICDFAVATESSYFSQAFSNIGLIPDTAGTYFLPKLLGRQLAHYLAFTGKKLSAQEAKNLGLIAEVFADEEFNGKSLEILAQIANMPTKALALTKKAFAMSYGNSLEKQLEHEGILQQEAAETTDFREGIAAFIEKRQPVYKGK